MRRKPHQKKAKAQSKVKAALTRINVPTRAEISDAAMAERAECVMLNKGPFILDAVRLLDSVLARIRV